MFIEFMKEWEVQQVSSPPVQHLTRLLQEIKEPAPVVVEEVCDVVPDDAEDEAGPTSPATTTETICDCGCRRSDHYQQQVGWPACSTCTACRGFKEVGGAKSEEAEKTNNQQEIP